MPLRPTAAHPSCEMAAVLTAVGEKADASSIGHPGDIWTGASRPWHGQCLRGAGASCRNCFFPAEHRRWYEPVASQLRRIRVDASAQVSVVTSLPRGSTAAIFDADDVTKQVAMSPRLVGSLQLIRTSRIAIAVGIEPLAVGTVAELTRAHGVSLRSKDTAIRIEADEAVSLEALDADADTSPSARPAYSRTSCRHVTKDQPYLKNLHVTRECP